ncbi:MAG TPA: glutathione S-transferase N-terminal domain-containing protein [Caulobacteraceae bacterium]|jgi:glutathione S-transferase
MITLYGRRNSINAQKALWTLGELGLSYQHVDAGGDAGGLDEPAFRAMNPHGRVPVLKDGEAAIWESNVIVRYLCGAYSPGVLCPTRPAERAELEAWIDWEQTTLQPAIMGYFWGFYRTPAPLRDAARNRECEEAAGAAIRILDSWLQHRPFIAGEAFSMADIPAGTLMFRYFEIDIERPEAPAVAAWRARLAERAPYREHVMRPFDELFGRLAY